MKINLVAGGPANLIPDFHLYDEMNVIWIGIDRGVFYLLKAGIKPSAAFGDFDSVSEAELTEIEEAVSDLNKFKPEKDETDMELALNWALEQEPESITIFGATGGRLDHLMANIQLLVKPLQQGSALHIEMIDAKNILFVKKPGCYSVSKLDEYKYISFLPVTPAVSGMTLKNFKYPLNDCHIPMGSTLCISNELIRGHGTFSFSEGILLVVRSKD
ncbi:thiamine diphosphokinase [Mesobacillus selenatarsenatis]|uniref:Thiamine diphosphokinase n=1 Tax=Mesobacillus selenatarsenatis (strain DSM 18680 / JCM 14380 / FERM P-15431 / SF-1) TaxID=1321606 RepID=A0A0A8X578_MESS1|nr:thiamine diphosphokinase [Mesobacillus selenatarsenatis]GAM14197.1 thiamin pyrophosphokinase [Mesobacillus selenatarsenatis SF-1]